MSFCSSGEGAAPGKGPGLPWDILVRDLAFRDAGAVSRLESECFPSSWTEEQYAKVLLDAEHYWAVGAFGERDGRCLLLGYIIGCRIVDELEILNVAVLPECRNSGIATQLLGRLLHRANKGSITKSCLEVRRSNLPAQRLYARAGFREEGVRRRYYADTGEDALIMVRPFAQDLRS